MVRLLACVLVYCRLNEDPAAYSRNTILVLLIMAKINLFIYAINEFRIPGCRFIIAVICQLEDNGLQVL